jgi:aspartate/methionine/tyrosine aminotransferase
MHPKELLKEGFLDYRRTPIERESPEQRGYENMRYNLTESSVSDMKYADLKLDIEDIVFSYTGHKGDLQLRRLIADESFNEDEVLVTTGAASSLFIAATSLLKPGDHVVILHPNYVTNIETPRAIGCKSEYLRLSFENGFRMDTEVLEGLINDDTRLVSITYPHNPTGMNITREELVEIVSIVESKGCFLLVDETYREMTFGKPLPVAASLSPRAISISSMSKSYGLPGIRIGWLISRDERLRERFLAAKEQIFICNSIVDERIALSFLKNKNLLFPKIKDHIITNFGIVKSWMENSAFMEWVEPSGGCVCFPRIKSGIDVEKFYNILNEKYRTFVGPGYWFEMDRRFMRIGYGWPTRDELEGGLDCITQALEESKK